MLGGEETSSWRVRPLMFKLAVHQAAVTVSAGYELRACPDHHVGSLSGLRSGQTDFPVRHLPEMGRDGGMDLILVLESPHIAEFKTSIGPAKGNTGRLIRAHISEIAKNFGLHPQSLTLVNAVQYQCSLGKKPIEHRDAVFRSAWSMFARVSFGNRLSQYINGADCIVVNACTKGNKSMDGLSLRELVVDEIFNKLNRPSNLRIAHPASWASAKNRKATW